MYSSRSGARTPTKSHPNLSMLLDNMDLRIGMSTCTDHHTQTTSVDRQVPMMFRVPRKSGLDRHVAVGCSDPTWAACVEDGSELSVIVEDLAEEPRQELRERNVPCTIRFERMGNRRVRISYEPVMQQD